MIRCKKRSIFINGLVIGGIGFLCYLQKGYVLSRDKPFYIEYILDCIGLVMVLTGQLLRIYGRGYKSRYHKLKTGLIESGPYNYVRNPMYLGSFYIGLGLAVLLAKSWVILLYLVLFLAWYAYQIHGEQIKLRSQYGKTYKDYCKKVPCLFPGPISFLKLISGMYTSLKFSWVQREWNTVLAWAVVLITVEGYSDSASYSYFFFFTELATFIVIALLAVLAIFIGSKFRVKINSLEVN